MNCIAQLIELLEPHQGQSITPTGSTSLIEDLGLSSIEIMELIEKAEDHFNIAVPLNNLENLHTLGELAMLIQSLLDVDK